jgi:hypothetical protein
MTAICFGNDRRTTETVPSEIVQQNTWSASLSGDSSGIDDTGIDKTYYGSHH